MVQTRARIATTMVVLVAAISMSGCRVGEVLPGLDGGVAPGGDGPPPVTVRWEPDGAAQLEAWTSCFGGMCADGMPPQDLLDVGSPDEVVVDFPLADWTFTADFTQVGAQCPQVHSEIALVERDGALVLAPAGSAGEWDVTLAGRGPQGDLFTSFRWTTPTDGPVQEPVALVAVLADHDGRLDSYGVELGLANLATTPDQAEATITVTTPDGADFAVLHPRLVDDGGDECGQAGTLNWRQDGIGRTSAQLAAIPVAAGPFTYEVEVVLDGTSHVARAQWPTDELADSAPLVPLVFDPPLPAAG